MKSSTECFERAEYCEEQAVKAVSDDAAVSSAGLSEGLSQFGMPVAEVPSEAHQPVLDLYFARGSVSHPEANQKQEPLRKRAEVPDVLWRSRTSGALPRVAPSSGRAGCSACWRTLAASSWSLLIVRPSSGHRRFRDSGWTATGHT
jgi:hypothetical protein